VNVSLVTSSASALLDTFETSVPPAVHTGAHCARGVVHPELRGPVTADTAGGIARFPDLLVGVSAAGYSLLFTAAGLLPGASEPFTVRFGDYPTRLHVRCQPSSERAAAAFGHQPVLPRPCSGRLF
jgi:hypothetical protein